MRVISLHRQDQIEPLLRRNVFLHIYGLGDLDDFFWPFTTWYALENDGNIQAILLLYTAFATPTIMALHDPPFTPMHELLKQTRRLLPQRFYAHLSPGCREAFGPDVRAETRGPHYKMALVNPALQIPGVERVQRLSIADVADLRALYALGYPENWFDPRQIETGHYYGLRVDGELVSAAGPHVYSQAQRVAALGNIVTHPRHRGQGFAAAVTARLCSELNATVDHIGLNVKADNATAIACYEKLGFQPIAEYEEVVVTLAATGDDA